MSGVGAIGVETAAGPEEEEEAVKSTKVCLVADGLKVACGWAGFGLDVTRLGNPGTSDREGGTDTGPLAVGRLPESSE